MPTSNVRVAGAGGGGDPGSNITLGVSGGTTGAVDSNTTVNVGTVTANSLITVLAAKYSPSQDDFLAADCTKSAGAATIGSVALDRQESIQFGTEWLHVGIFSCIVSGGGTLTMQVAVGPSGSVVNVAVAEYINSANCQWDATRLEDSDVGEGTSSGVAATGSMISADGAVFIGVVTSNTGVDGSGSDGVELGSGYSLIDEEENGNANLVYGAEYRIVTAGTTDTVDWVLNTSNTAWCAVGAIYKEVST